LSRTSGSNPLRVTIFWELGVSSTDRAQGIRFLRHEESLMPGHMPGNGRGRVIVAFQPAGLMEAFFNAMANIKGAPAQNEVARLLSEHGMAITGPSLS
jgi:hypothetical protein